MNKRTCNWIILGAILVAAGVSVWLVQSSGQGPEKAIARISPDQPGSSADGASGYVVSPFVPGDFQALAPAKRSPSDLKLVCPSVNESPVIDGIAGDAVWSLAKPITTLDFPSQRTITIRAVHTSDTIFFLVTFPDVSPSTTHKSFRWDREAGIYKPYNDREDMFAFKWSMQGLNANLLLRGGQPHRGDIWFWKACRTNPAGYADDKSHSYSTQKQNVHATEITPLAGNSPMYLLRTGDSGQSAYEEKIALDHQGPFAPRFINRQPTGSRADVSARGCWREGGWTVEFARKLDTGHDDDVAFTAGGRYLFIVSCYEMSGDTVHPEWSQPLYRTGDGFDRIVLEITR
ncbi:MAG: ethylbenzene dehydrogenase-related protein [Phycisphaerae bacterium]|jgi:hypothetical protein|nr:ethylbenzene dehydrogenase-related protein [Phycisphaerae bacterium]